MRLAALTDYDILDTPAEQGFDDLTLLASQICETPVALVSLVDRDRQWFKAHIGFPGCQTDLNSSVCKFVLAEPDVMVIPDLTLDPRTNVNPLVTGDPNIRFYAGAPLRTPEGVTIGSLCVIDTKPRSAGLTENQRDALRALGRHVTSLLDLRRNVTRSHTAEAALRLSEVHYRTLFDKIDEGFCIIEFIDGPHGPLSNYVHVEANPACESHLGIRDMVGTTIRDIGPDEADGWVAIYGQVLRTGEPIRFEREFVTNNRHLEVAAHRVEPASRNQVAVLFRDITTRVQAEIRLRASEASARLNIERVQLALAAGAIIGTWFWDPITDRFTVDDGFASTFSLDPTVREEGVTLAHIMEALHPDDRAGLAAAIEEALVRGGAYVHQYRTRRADGRYYWVEANGRVDKAPDGTPISFPGVFIDIEDRRAAEVERARYAGAAQPQRNAGAARRRAIR